MPEPSKVIQVAQDAKSPRTEGFKDCFTAAELDEIANQARSQHRPTWMILVGAALAICFAVIVTNGPRESNFVARYSYADEAGADLAIVYAAARPVDLTETLGLVAHSILRAIEERQAARETDVKRLARALRHELEAKVLFERVERVYARMDRTNPRHLDEFSRLVGGYAYPNGDVLHWEQARAFFALRDGKLPTDALLADYSYEVDAAFRFVFHDDRQSQEHFLATYARHPHAVRSGHVRQVLSWLTAEQERKRLAAEQEDRLRLEQQSVPWDWD